MQGALSTFLSHFDSTFLLRIRLINDTQREYAFTT